MRNKSLFLLLACVCGTVAAIGVSQWMQAQNKSGGGFETVEIFVTVKEIDVQEEITADKIRLEQWPADKVPAGATADLKEVEGRYAKQAFYAGEPMLSVKLMNDKDDVIVPKGYSVVSMPADRGGIANLVKQQDRVDVRAYFTKNELIPRTTSKTILSGVRVFAIDGKTKRDDEASGQSKQVRTISLLIRKADEEAWTYAEKLGEISLSLGSPGDYENSTDVTEASPAGQEFLQWLADLREQHEKARLEGLEQDDTGVSEPSQLAPAPKKKTFQMLKMHEGKMTLFEWEEGKKIPRIVEVVGEESSSSKDDTPAPAKDTKDDLDHLLGEDSPFFQPRGQDGSSSENSYKRTRN